jgi:hypothetical protein
MLVTFQDPWYTILAAAAAAAAIPGLAFDEVTDG